MVGRSFRCVFCATHSFLAVCSVLLFSFASSSARFPFLQSKKRLEFAVSRKGWRMYGAVVAVEPGDASEFA